MPVAVRRRDNLDFDRADVLIGTETLIAVEIEDCLVVLKIVGLRERTR